MLGGLTEPVAIQEAQTTRIVPTLIALGGHSGANACFRQEAPPGCNESYIPTHSIYRLAIAVTHFHLLDHHLLEARHLHASHSGDHTVIGRLVKTLLKPVSTSLLFPETSLLLFFVVVFCDSGPSWQFL